MVFVWCSKKHLYQKSVRETLDFLVLSIPSNISFVQHDVRSSRAEVFSKKGVLENFAKFTWKCLCQSVFSNKVAGLFFKKKRLLRKCFPLNFEKFSRTSFFIEHLRWLLLRCKGRQGNRNYDLRRFDTTAVRIVLRTFS